MGAWGYKIKQNDTVNDVIDDFNSLLKQNQNLELTTIEITKKYADSINDSDDGPLFWIGLAEIQWKYGYLQKEVFQHVKSDYEQGVGLDIWLESGLKTLNLRKKELSSFLHKLEQPNSKPSKMPKRIIRKPLFNKGDCLSVKLVNGQYGACIVLASRNENPEYGINLIGTLNYMSPSKPTKNDFEKRNWLVLTHHSWKNVTNLLWCLPIHYKKFLINIEIVHQTPIRSSDPFTEYCPYGGLEHISKEIISQRHWDEGIRD